MTDRPPPSEALFVPHEAGRRTHSRYRVELRIGLASAHNFYQGLAQNLSVGGLFIATHTPRPVGEVLEFTVSLPDGGAPIAGAGQVRWVRQYSETSDTAPGMGLRFVSISEDAIRRIQQFLDQREPLFFEED